MTEAYKKRFAEALESQSSFIQYSWLASLSRDLTVPLQYKPSLVETGFLGLGVGVEVG